MSMLWMENFQLYNGDTANALENGVWAAFQGSSIVADPDGVSSGDVLKVQIYSVDLGDTRFIIPTPGDHFQIGFRLWLDQMPSSTLLAQEIVFRDASNTARYAVRTSPTGTLSVVRKTDETVLGTSAAAVMGAGAWYHIEFLMDSTTGDYEVRVEGATVLTGIDATPATGNFGLVAFVGAWKPGSGGTNSQPYVKDLTLADDAGSVNNSFIGPVTVYTLLVDGDVSSGWTKSTGTSDYALLDTLAPDDTTYIEADATLPAPSIMTFQDLPIDIVGVRACQSMARIEKTDGGDCNVQVGLSHAGSTDLGADTPSQTSWRYQWDISELDPSTAAQWTPTGVNAATIQINRTL